jgi:hypothetical protein
MGFLIRIPKTDQSKALALNGQLLELCEGIVDREDYLIYIPLSGKVINVLKILSEKKVSYELKSDPSEILDI